MRARRGGSRRRLLAGAAALTLLGFLVAHPPGVADAADGSWTTAAPTGSARQEVSYVEAGGRFYLAGGKTDLHQAYDPATNRWSTVAPLPTPDHLDHIQVAAVAGRIYYIGGMTHWPHESVGTVHVYDTRTNTFSAGAPMPAGRDRGAGGIAVAGGRIYLAGGVHDGTTVPWFDVYDPSTDSWSRLPDLPQRRDHFHAAVVGGKFWAIGGRVSSSATRVGHNQAFDLATGRWTTGLAPLPTLRAGFAVAVFGSEIVVIGGEGGGATYDEAEAYDTATDRWRSLTPMPTARHGIQAVMWNGAAHIAAGGMKMGGAAPTAVHEVLRLSPSSSRRPDGHIRLSTQSAFVGDGVYNATGAQQTRSTTSGAGQQRSFVVRMQNDATAQYGLTLRGCAASPGFQVRYYVGATGTTEITAAVVGGTYAVPGVAPGGTRTVRLEVATGAATTSGATQSCPMTVGSTSDAATTDTVLARVTVP